MKSFSAAELVILAVFGGALAATIAGALVAVLTQRIIRSVCGLAICCCGLAGLYYFLQSPFLSLMEILIYVGAICVTIVFAVMLAEPDEAPAREQGISRVWWTGSALLASGVAFWGITHLGLTHRWPNPVTKLNGGAVKDIGVSLLTTYSFAFELISLVLVIAVIGALVIARQGRSKA